MQMRLSVDEKVYSDFIFLFGADKPTFRKA